MKKITDNIYMENELSVCNNSYVVTSDGVVVIDTPMMPDAARKIVAETAKFGTVRYVINGEPHSDHVSGNYYYGGTVVSHEGSRETMQEMKVEDLIAQIKQMAPDSPPPDSDFRYRLPEITFSESMTLYLGDHTFHLIHMPGHTPYNLAVHVPEERTVFTSDNISLGMPIFFDSVPDKWLESISRLEELDVDIVVPGHGEVCGKEAFARMSQSIKDWVNLATGAIDRGLSIEETIELIISDKRFGDIPREGFLQANVEALYRILKPL
ncbi:MAG: MBL fold metallo-hydrolase [Dehalococcoidia bacterium]|jgi:cyclase